MPDVSEFVAHWGYLAIVVIVVLGNVGLPVPEESALLAGGYLVWRGDLMWSGVLTVGVVSAVAGDNVGYWIGRRYGPRGLERLRRLVGITSQQLQSMRALMVRWGPLGVFVARFIPGLRFLAGPLAGTVGLPFTAFLTANVLGAVVYVPVIVAAGYAVGYGAGPHVERVLRTFGPVEYVVLTVAVVAAGTVFLWRAMRA